MTQIFQRLVIFIFCTISLSGFAQDSLKISLEDIWKKNTFGAGGVYGFVHLKNGSQYCRLVSAQGYAYVVSYNYSDGNSTDTLINGRKLAENSGEAGFSLESFEFSRDEQKAVIISDSRGQYRHSSFVQAWVYDRISGKLTRVSEKWIMYPTLSPDGQKIAYVYDNNLYIKDLKKGKTRKITKDGKQNSIINGAVDWVYEEEFSMSRGFEWNADGSRLAFYKFNESAVKTWDMEIYSQLYPEQFKYKYPKAGEANSKVDVYVYDVKKKKAKRINTGSENDQYLPRIYWSKKPETLIIQRLNRLQNHWEWLTVNAKSGQVAVAWDEKSETYIDIPEVFHFLNDGEHVIVSSERDGYRHLYLHKIEGPQVFQITKGNFDVAEFCGIDEKSGELFYSTPGNNPAEVHIFKCTVEGKNHTPVLNERGTHTIHFSQDLSFMLHQHSNADQPPVYAIRNRKAELVRTLQDNATLKEKMKKYGFSPVQFGKLTTDQNIELNYWMIQPSKMEDGKKYPVLMYVYGGPGSQTVKDGWGYSNYVWYQMLANTYGYIIVSVDNRGTGMRGEQFKKCTYKQLGKLETEDQIGAAKWIAQQPWADASRIGIWGWSYGGYMSSLCISKGNQVFKTAIAVAPVTNWRYYDNIYTERYMQTPQLNPKGYDDNSPISHVDSIRGNYLIVHGTADDNVHFQNTVEMIRKMIDKNITFDSEIYPDKNHGIYGGNTRYHLYDRMTKYILENL